ncbi:hypothetical protein ABT336_10860 [Micromonospora sp. NPDC000207]|uniref:hypothetical protein n=1 Tax=Micromonospora sp. NPDC000207 TaxID=3154246 RepID=UPI0033305FDE
MRGDLDETLARMARREEALRRAAEPTGGHNARPLPDSAGPAGAGAADRTGAPAVGGAIRPVQGEPADRPTGVVVGTARPASGGGPVSGRVDAPTAASGPPVGAERPDRPGTLPRREAARGSVPAIEAAGGRAAVKSTGPDPVQAVAEAVRRALLDHPGVTVTLRVEHSGQTYPMRLGGPETAPAQPWPIPVRTTPPWQTDQDGATGDPAARLAEMIRRNPSLLHGDPTP